MVFLKCVVEEKRHVVPANEGAADPHKINTSGVVHELQELYLCVAKVVSGDKKSCPAKGCLAQHADDKWCSGDGQSCPLRNLIIK